MQHVATNSLFVVFLSCVVVGCGEGSQPISSEGVMPPDPLTNQPPPRSIVRYVLARPGSADGYSLPRRDGEFILRVTSSLHEISPDHGLPNHFALVAWTENHDAFALIFTTNAQSVYVYPGGPLLRVPANAATQIVQRVERVMRRR
jgi:hypothetical protein